MRLLIFYAFLSLFCLVFSKNTNIKSLTESLGQEVIEIAGPKELPTGVEEEPSAENDDEDIKTTSFKKELNKITTVLANRKPLKDYEKIDGNTADDEEVRLEKELAEIYKDPEYKDSSEVTNTLKDTNKNLEDIKDVDKAIARSRDGFKFAPDSTDKMSLERFRTSIDDINCNERSKLKLETATTTTTTTSRQARNSSTKSNVFINILFNTLLVKFII